MREVGRSCGGGAVDLGFYSKCSEKSQEGNTW